MNKFYIIVFIFLCILACAVFCVVFNNGASKESEKLLLKYYKELEVNPNNAVAYMEIARDNITAYPKPYDEEKALRDISKAIELDANLTEAYKLRAMLYYYTLGKKELALQDLNKVLELMPNDEFALDLKKDISEE